jgi:hypothetical protein
MRTWIAALVAALATAVAPTGALAQDWQVFDRPEGGVYAVSCLEGYEIPQVFTSLCVSVECEPGLGPTFGLGIQQVPLPPETRVKIAVDGRQVATLSIPVEPGGWGGSVPLEGHERLVEALQLGQVAQVSVATFDERRDYELPLLGSADAIDAALAACPLPEEAPSPEVSAMPVSADPAQAAIADNESFCADGAAEVGPEFRQDLDLDGDGRDDLILDYLGLICDGSRAFCGTGGCSMEVWLGQPDGTYRLLVDDQFVEIEPTGPGLLRLVRDGGWCGLSGAEICEGTYAITEGRLEPVQ